MRAARAAVDVVPVPGAGMIAVVVHQAIGGPVVVAGPLFVIASGYLGMLVILVVFGIWGFRLGARGSTGNPGGGGPKRPEPVTPPPGGRELREKRLPSVLDVSSVFELPGLEEQVPERAHDLVAPGSHR
jgi:hypothetical protein